MSKVQKVFCPKCGSKRLQNTSDGFSCKECGAVIKTSVQGENEDFQHLRGLRNKNTITEKKDRKDRKTPKNQVDQESEDLQQPDEIFARDYQNDQQEHLKDYWMDYLETYQEILKFQTKKLKEAFSFDQKFEENIKQLSRYRLISNFTVPRPGLFRINEESYPQSTSNKSLKKIAIQEIKQVDEEEQLITLEEDNKIPLDYEMIFSQQINNISSPILSADHQSETQQQQQNEENKLDNENIEEQQTIKKIQKYNKDDIQKRKNYYLLKYRSNKLILQDSDQVLKLVRKRSRRSISNDNYRQIQSSQMQQSTDSQNGSFMENDINFDKYKYFRDINKIKEWSEETLDYISKNYIKSIYKQKTPNILKKIKSMKSANYQFPKQFLVEELNERNMKDISIMFSNKAELYSYGIFLLFVYDYIKFRNNKGQEHIIIQYDIFENLKEYIEQQLQSNQNEFKDLVVNKFNKIRNHMEQQKQQIFESDQKVIVQLDMTLLICIIYYCIYKSNFPIFPRDIRKWIKIGLIPFFEVASFKTKQNLIDYIIEPNNIPSAEYIRTQTKKLLNWIGEKDFNRNVSYHCKIQRILVDIGLENTLVTKVEYLYDILTTENMKQYLQNSFDKDFYILGTVLILAKLIYGLHDKTYGVFIDNLQFNELFKIVKENQPMQDILKQYQEDIQYLKSRDQMAQEIIKIEKNQLDFIRNISYQMENNLYDTFIQYKNNFDVPFSEEDLFKLTKDPQQLEEYIDLLKTNLFKESDKLENINSLTDFLDNITIKDNYQQNDQNINFIQENNMCNTTNQQIGKFTLSEAKFIRNLAQKVYIGSELPEIPLPCERYHKYQQFSTMMPKDHHYEYILILRFFQNYIEENIEHLFKALKHLESNLIICSKINFN